MIRFRADEVQEMFATIKAKLSLCFAEHHAIKAYWKSGGIAPAIIDLGTRWR